MTTRSQKKTASSSVLPNKRVENSWVLLVKDEESVFLSEMGVCLESEDSAECRKCLPRRLFTLILKRLLYVLEKTDADSVLENSNLNIITLPHPANGKPTKYCLDSINSKMYEVVTFNEPYRSWFIGESVKSNGSLQIMTLVNPLFLVLPRLKEQCTSRAIPLEDLLSEKGFNKTLNFVKNLDSIADLKGPADMKAYKYNEEKTLTWLQGIVRKLATMLRDKNIHVTSGAVSATFIQSNISNDSVNEDFYLKYACGMVSEYLQDEFVNMLEESFHFKSELIESVGKKRKSEIDSNEKNKKLKCDPSDMEHIEDKVTDISELKFSELKKQKPLTTKEKARQRAASGTKTISTFFTKK